VPAYVGPAAAKALEALIALFVLLSGSNSDSGSAILEFRADEFLPGEMPADPAVHVGRRTREEVDQACPRHGEVQQYTDEAADAVRRGGRFISGADFGTRVHSQLKQAVDQLKDPDLRAEVSAIKSGPATYGQPNSIRVDVLENVRNGTVCVYDIKTGRSPLTLARMFEIASNVHSYYAGTRRILVIEVRSR
jgi:hypothetical protein